MSWCGYIDLLGSRDAARRSAQDLLESLDSFHSALEDAIPEFEGDCFAFSDGAFFTCERFEQFHPFLRRIRNQMFQASTYFRCSFIPGEIGVNNRGSKRSGGRQFVSYTFTKSAPEAYQTELNFKGVGCIVDIRGDRHRSLKKKIAESSDEERSKLQAEYDELEAGFRQAASKQIVPTFFVELEGRKLAVRASSDYRYSEFEVCRPTDAVPPSYPNEIRLFDQMVSACYAALARSSKVASYYVSALAAVIRSTDLAKVDWDEKEAAWVEAPYPFQEFMSEHAVRLLREVPGFHLLLLAAFDQLFCAQEGQLPKRVETQVMRQLGRIPACFKNLDRIPDCVISVLARQRLIELKLSTAREGRQLVRAPK